MTSSRRPSHAGFEQLVADKIATYQPEDALEQELVLAELLQQVALAAFADAGFFARAAFHGGTCLRIFFGLRRFSEDLDFVLRKRDPSFAWPPYLEALRARFDAEGLDVDTIDRSALSDAAVKKAFLKTNSLGQLLDVWLPHARDPRRKLRVKLEIDTHPPGEPALETRFLTFPAQRGVTVQTLSSAFAGKLHALLCRSYVKGRDWYDLLWFIERRVAPDLPLLAAALEQHGPWAGQQLDVDGPWLREALGRRIDELDWAAARKDVQRFVPAREQPGVANWSVALFSQQLERLDV
jgi:hypothetical protein